MPGQTIQINNLTGLHESEVPVLRNQYGGNIFVKEGSRNFRRLLNMVTGPMFLMLLLACALYFILKEPEEGFLMLVAMIFVAAISFYQEAKSSRALNALIQFTESKVTVVRDGREKMIPAEELLPGDIMILEEGSRVSADGIVVQQNDLTVDESVISGESLPVEKNEREGHNLLFQGTIINSGRCYARVTAIGNMTVMGKLGKSISAMPPEKTPLQNQLNRLLKFMALPGIIAFAVIWIVNYLDNNEAVQSLLFALSLAMSIVPEEIPVAYSSFMALGAYQMAKLGIIARNPSTIENLGAVNIICIDKTGTITENKMEVRVIYDYENDLVEEMGPGFQGKNVLRLARLASEPVPFDAMEKGIAEACEMYMPGEPVLKMIYEYPLSGRPPMMTHVYDYGGARAIAGKGAPERILKVSKISDPEIRSIRQKMEAMASRGFRMIGVCSATHTGTYPKEQDDFNWKFEGLLALYDPPKKGVRQVLEQWYGAGIQVKLLTGDFPGTAKNIAGQVGIRHCDQGVSGDQVMQASETELLQLARRTALFARMFPEAKLKLVNALKDAGNVVAMTGDGVNDGPALKSAHIGIAMGKKGTEIARHAADLILTDDQPGKITDAIEQGRKIYTNLKKAIRYIISIHIPIILTVMLPLLLGWKYANIFTPIHIIFLELIMGPTCSIFFEQEPAELNIMNIGPRKAGPGIFSSSELFVSIIQGIVMTIGLLAVYYYFMVQDFTVEYTRTMVFITILLGNVFLTFTNRSFEKTITETMRYKNRFVPLVLGISIVFISSLLFVPPLQKLFYLTPVRPLHFILSLGISILSAGWFEIYKLVSGRFRKFIVILFLCTLPRAAVSGQDHPPGPSGIGSRTDTVRLFYPRLVNTFYGIGQQERFWFSENEQSLLLRLALKDIIDSAANIGLDKNKYHYAELVNYTSKDLPAPDPSIATSIDSIFTDIAIAFFKDIYQGANISSLVSADGLSAKYSVADDHYILRRLSEARSAILLRQTAGSLEPGVPAYLLLKEKLIKELKTPRPDTVRSLVTTLNLFRWIYHFRLNQFIVINIPSASLLYYESDTLKLKMKVVLGKPSTRTPRFAAYCDQIILYPYWNVPRKIAVGELLPLFKKSPGLIDAMNMQVVDNKGEILDPRKLTWSAFDKSNFPYRFRQSTGCDNALGVIKFNLTSPFDVYMHDTNLKSAFQSSFRYYSHGCIRLEKPIELGNFLLHGGLDPGFLKSCLKDQKPVTLKLDKPVPVFAVYGLAGADEMSNIIYYKDIYRLMRQTAR